MKSVLNVILPAILAVAAVSCGTTKTVSSPAPGEVTQVQTVEGNTVNDANWKQFGFAPGDYVNKSGEIVQRPYAYFTGNATSPNLRIAEEMARSAAYSLISDTFNIKNLSEKVSKASNDITDKLEEGSAEKLALANEEWARYLSQQSSSTLRGFTPFGETKIQFDEQTRMYTVWARVGMPYKAWQKIYESVLNYKPKELTSKELDVFTKVQKDVLGAVFQIAEDDNE